MSGDNNHSGDKAAADLEAEETQATPSKSAEQPTAEPADRAADSSSDAAEDDDAPDAQPGEPSAEEPVTEDEPPAPAAEDEPAAAAADTVDDSPPPEDLPPPEHLAPAEALPQPPDIPPPASVPVPRPAPAPTVLPSAVVTDVAPTEGPTIGGTRVKLEGQHLYRESIVRFGGALATTVGATVDRELRVEAPPMRTPGKVDISIQNPGSELTVVEKAYSYEPLPAPKITSVAPVRGAVAGGTELSITGQNFVAGTVVLLDGQPAADAKLVADNTLEVKTPPGKAGKMIDVAVKNPDGKQDVSRRAFLYDERYDK